MCHTVWALIQHNSSKLIYTLDLSCGILQTSYLQITFHTTNLLSSLKSFRYLQTETLKLLFMCSPPIGLHDSSQFSICKYCLLVLLSISKTFISVHDLCHFVPTDGPIQKLICLYIHASVCVRVIEFFYFFSNKEVYKGLTHYHAAHTQVSEHLLWLECIVFRVCSSVESRWRAVWKWMPV